MRFANDKIWDFDHRAGHYDKVVAMDSQIYARYDKVLDVVAEIATRSPGKRVLDIGTGTGNLALRCLAHRATVVGLDPSEQMLVKAREKTGENLRAEFCQVDEPFLHIPYPDASFDAVTSTYAFHHVPRRLKRDSLREMIRVLRPSGVWVLGDLVFENVRAERKALREYEWLEEEYFARIEEVRSELTRLGMKLDTCQFTPVTWVLWAVKPERADGKILEHQEIQVPKEP